MDGVDKSELRELLQKLRSEHSEIEKAISSMQAIAGIDSLDIQRLKKQKLNLKDKITHLEDQLLPDIIA